MSDGPLSTRSWPATARASLDRILTGRATEADLLWARPERVLTGAGVDPDPWQAEVLRSPDKRILMLCSRQAGKSLTAAALVLLTALREPGSLTLLLSPTLRQSGELFRAKVLTLWQALGRPQRGRNPTQLTLELANGSRVVSLPESEGSIRGYSGVSLLVVDEASRVSEGLYAAVRPMLAVSRGRLIGLSTPFGKRGWFHDEWHGRGRWHRVRVTADQCPRITREFLDEERLALGPRWYRQEYECSFEDVVDAVFAFEDIQAALSDDVQPLFG